LGGGAFRPFNFFAISSPTLYLVNMNGYEWLFISDDDTTLQPLNGSRIKNLWDESGVADT
jgi:hypothetical protein